MLVKGQLPSCVEKIYNLNILKILKIQNFENFEMFFPIFFEFQNYQKTLFFRQQIDEIRPNYAKFGFYASNCVECADRQLWAIFLAHFPDCLGLSLTLCLVLATDTLSWLGH